MRTLQLQKPTLVVSLLNWSQTNNYAKVWPLCWVPTEKSDTRSKPWQQTKQTKHKWRQKQQKQQTNKQTNGLAFWNSENKMWVTGFQREHYTHICSTYNTIYFEEDSHLINMVLDLLLRRIHIGSDDPDVGISSRNLQNKKMKTSRTNPLLLLDKEWNVIYDECVKTFFALSSSDNSILLFPARNIDYEHLPGKKHSANQILRKSITTDLLVKQSFCLSREACTT